MRNVLVFDIWGRYAHYKKIFATTSALSYALPSKTAMYGYVGAVIGLDKFDNQYLNAFAPESCRIGLQLQRPITMQRVATNLHPHTKGLIRATQNRKPTTIEYVYAPHYRIYFWHENEDLYQQLKAHLLAHTAVYTPCLGLANLFSNFELIGEYEMTATQNDTASVAIDSAIPRSYLERLDVDFADGNQIMEYSQFAVEMNTEREVTKRDDLFFDRNGQAIRAQVNHYFSFTTNNETKHVVLF